MKSLLFFLIAIAVMILTLFFVGCPLGGKLYKGLC